MAFRFRLEKVLAVRRREEEEAERRHAEARRERDRAREEVERQRAALARANEALDALKRKGEMSAEDLFLHASHVAGVRRRLREAEAGLAEAEDRMRREHEALLQAHQAREALEKLREREEARWKEAERRRETQILDEVALTRRPLGEEEPHGP